MSDHILREVCGKTYAGVPVQARTTANMNIPSEAHARAASPQIEIKQVASWPNLIIGILVSESKFPEYDTNRTHLGPVNKSGTVDAISFCFVAKVPREITAVSRTTKYTTAMMLWNNREHPFRFDGIGASILKAKWVELLKALTQEYSLFAWNDRVYTNHHYP